MLKTTKDAIEGFFSFFFDFDIDSVYFKSWEVVGISSRFPPPLAIVHTTERFEGGTLVPIQPPLAKVAETSPEAKMLVNHV